MSELWTVQHSYLIPLLPLIGAAIAGFFGARWLRGGSHWPIWLGVGASAVLSIVLLLQTVALLGQGSHAGTDPAHPPLGAANPSVSAPVKLFTWIAAGDPSKAGTNQYFVADAAFFFDPLTVTMLCVVCGIGFLICVFAAGYMRGEEGYWRFFAYLGLFIFMMCCLVMGDNLIMLYLGWEGVGLCSYLLIGYYYQKPSARDAAKKAFLVNRIGDFGFGVGIMLAFAAFGTVSYFGADGYGGTNGLLEAAAHPETLSEFQRQVLWWLPFLLMLGAFGKSAQFPLYVWLPDAMEGPTPVSALIHAATMVTAGVYMIARCGTLFVGNDAALMTVAFIGSFTALLAASIALRQFDLKKVFAYSTISQLGFMFVGVGVLAPVAGVFHLVTHAFFKALLFLSSGVVMHAMLGHLDMRQMSGLKAVLPKTRWLMLIGCLALAGVVPFAGFWSKDEIVAAAWHASPLLGAVMLLTALLTAYYTFRLYFRVFEGPRVVPDTPHPDHHGSHEHGDSSGGAGSGHGGHHSHEPAIMILPLVFLAIGSVIAGVVLWQGHRLGHFLGHSPSFVTAGELATATFNPKAADEHHLVNPLGFGLHDTRPAELQQAEQRSHYVFMLLSTVIALAGIAVAYTLHLRDRPKADRLALRLSGIARAIENKYWVDELYQASIVEPLRRLGQAFYAMDRFVVDGLVWLAGFIPQLGGFILKLTTQRGYLQGYALSMVLGVAVILFVVFL
ncbi:MAG: NADH-quinone oxidoreductase subunit L [Phycisphaerae bacterium]|nr:NADH-quinone oxidoreductase subunit L [Phycisphaerae bacterium]MDW8262630.1 NADH-quinone oxidoreductase subunit L [Phycisphaerales bacterium]